MIIIRSKQNDPALEEQILALLRREHIEAEQFSLSTQQLLSVPVSYASSMVWRRLTISMALRAQS